MVKSKVYIETSVISYLTARPSRDVIACARIAHDVMLYVQSLGYPGTVLCTPQTLMKEYDE